MSFPVLRKRYASMPVVGGGLSRIFQGVFGVGSPASQLSSPDQVKGENAAEGGVYNFHEGDLFTPGTSNWVMDPSHETALMTVWGHAFLRSPNTFNPIQPVQVYANPTAVLNGIGGPVAGQLALQPLEQHTQNPETGA